MWEGSNRAPKQGALRYGVIAKQWEENFSRVSENRFGYSKK